MLIMIKVYALYLKQTKELYAFTDDKTLYKSFITERNKRLFIIKKFTLKDDEFKKFRNKNKKLSLIRSCLYDGHRDMPVVATIDEENTLDFISDIIVNEIARIRANLKNILDDKHLKIIVESTSIVTEANYVQLDTFALFYYLFRYTFVDADKAETVKNATEKFIKE